MYIALHCDGSWMDRGSYISFCRLTLYLFSVSCGIGTKQSGKQVQNEKER